MEPIEIQVIPFNTREPNSEFQAKKVLEEAAELLAADKEKDAFEAFEEACDVIQSAVNYCVMRGFGQDAIRFMLWHVTMKNQQRGRYE